VRLYWEVMCRGFRRYSTYVGATLAGIFTNTVFGFVKAYILVALFAARPVLGGYRIDDALTYSFIAQGLLATVAIWGWFEIDERVRTGDVATDLLRPQSFLGYWLAHDLGRAGYQAVARGIPPFLVAALVFDLRLPERPETWPVFAVSVGLAVTVSFAMRAMVNLSAFWLLDSRGLAGIVSTAWIFLSGLALPLAVFPDSLRSFARLTPFAMTFDAPAQIFLEQASGFAAGATLVLQAGWAAVLLVAAERVLGAGTRKLVIQGG
jgi:ABC-2 type transport system permease protein